MRIRLLVGLALTLSVVAAPAYAIDFPTRPMEMVVPFTAGGNTDLLARLLADGLQQELKQPVAVLNKPGAGTNIGASFVANSKP
ncbi:MAG: Bug family tripartite tricarboxylate transporter substrate binding protein, partial [Candidatus Angelobacter sp.]